jgi:hypothetical protein
MTDLKIIFIFLFLLTPAVSTLWPVDYQEYVNKKLGISFSYPADWECREEPQQVLLLSPSWENQDKERAAFGIQIINLEYAEEKTVQDYFEEMMRENFSNFSKPDTVEIDGKDWFHVSVSDPENNLGGELFLLKIKDVLYLIVTAFEPPESGKRFLDSFNLILRSIKILQIHQE